MTKTPTKTVERNYRDESGEMCTKVHRELATLRARIAELEPLAEVGRLYVLWDDTKPPASGVIGDRLDTAVAALRAARAAKEE